MSKGPSGDMTAYYARRASEYEEIYDKPERQEDLARLRSDLPALFRGHDVLEVACGTGYWTSQIAAQAQAVLATDVGDEVLAVARSKPHMPPNVTFAKADAFSFDDVDGVFNAAMVGFWWSHVLIEKRDAFLDVLCAKLKPNALVVMVDNRQVASSSTPVHRTDERGNTFQLRTVRDGSQFEVVKNFDTEESIHSTVDRVGTIIRCEALTHYWWCAWRVQSRECEA